MKYSIYHNPRCTKSRQGLAYLNDKGYEVEVIEYLKDSPSADELKEVIKKLGIKAEELIRKNEADFKTNFKGKSLSDDEWVQAMLDYPKLIERPIIIKGDKAVVGRPTEKIAELE